MEVKQRKDMDLFQHVCNFFFCLHKGVEIEKCSTFVFNPIDQDYLIHPQLQSIVKFTSQVPMVGVTNRATPESTQCPPMVVPLME